jgi:DNA polymerase-1
MRPATPEAVQLVHEGALVLAQMEHNGIRVDTDYLTKAIVEVEGRIKGYQEQLRADEVYRVWRKKYGEKTNLASREQLGNVLFNVLEHDYSQEKTKTNCYRTDEEVIRAVNIPFTDAYLELARWQKVLSTYLRGLQRETVDGYVHPVFNLHLADTYRSSSDSVNIQNQINRDQEAAALIRRCYIARKGRCLVEVDEGQLEFRGAAWFWKDPGMVAYASDPKKDIHGDEAANMFLCNYEQVSKMMRHLAKNLFVFRTLYGGFYLQVAKDVWEAFKKDKTIKLKDDSMTVRKWLLSKGIKKLGECDLKQRPIPGTFEHHMKSVETSFMKRFPLFGEGRVTWYEQYKKRGWFRTLSGFVIQGVYNRNDLLNYPVQSICFHVLLYALIELQKELRKRKMRTKLIAEVHDCILADVPEDELQDFIPLAKECMTDRVRKHWDWIITPLTVEVDVTPVEGDWGSKRPWICENGSWKAKA